MTRENQIISLWRQGHNTHEIAFWMTAFEGRPWYEHEVHRIIGERETRRKAKREAALQLAEKC